jgi:hypothetical protein
MNDADRFRKQAEDQMAEKSISALDKETWLRIAEDWLRLAQGVEAREGKR